MYNIKNVVSAAARATETVRAVSHNFVSFLLSLYISEEGKPFWNDLEMCDVMKTINDIHIIM